MGRGRGRRTRSDGVDLGLRLSHLHRPTTAFSKSIPAATFARDSKSRNPSPSPFPFPFPSSSSFALPLPFPSFYFSLRFDRDALRTRLSPSRQVDGRLPVLKISVGRDSGLLRRFVGGSGKGRRVHRRECVTLARARKGKEESLPYEATRGNSRRGNTLD